MGRTLTTAALALAVGIGSAGDATAQSLGTFRWQLQPYCNVVNLTVTQNGGLYTLDGYDDQCGAATRASALGTAVPNPNGTITIGFSIVTTPGGAPVHVQTAISLATLGGSWSDSAGHTGTFVFTPGAGTGGAPRPEPLVGIPDNSVTSAKIADGAVGALDIDPAQVQQRIQNACPTGELMAGVNQDGTVVCTPVTSGAGGDITAVIAGTGLAGGSLSGNATLSVIYGGSGAAGSAARSDHSHNPGGTANTRVGEQALPVILGVGSNTAIGYRTLNANTSGVGNTAVGAAALSSNLTGLNNLALGTSTLQDNVSGSNNSGIGTSSLASLTSGNQNTAVGTTAMRDVSFASDSTAVGYQAGLAAGTRITAVGSMALGFSANGSTAVGYAALANSRGTDNVAIGSLALTNVNQGDYNVVVGSAALTNLGTGSGNVAVGRSAGLSLTSGSDNLYLDHAGAVSESATIRLGRGAHTRAFLAGVRGVTTGVNNAVPVVIDSAGQLGTVSSSRKTKFDIADLDTSVMAAVQRLRPVQFRYTKAFADGSTPIQYGLIAEEVEAILPELVAYDANGDPATVKYHVLPALLLAEVQRLSREVAALQTALATARR